MKTMQTIVALMFITLLAACSSVPLKDKDATKVFQESLFAFQSLPSSSYGTIIVTRDASVSACPIWFSINSTAAAKFLQSETATFYVPIGEVILKVWRGPDFTLCFAGRTDVLRETTIKNGETKRFSLVFGEGGFNVQRAD